MCLEKRSGPPVRNHQDGAIVVVLAVSLTVLVGFGALAIDSGFQGLLRTQLQNIADASALAGALSLDLSVGGIERSRRDAVWFAGANQLAGQSYTLENDEFEAGVWNWSTETFSHDTSDAARVNAVRTSPKYTVKPILMNALSPELNLEGRAVSIAARAPISGGCALPIAIPSCEFAGKSPAEICGMDLIFNADGADSAGWASLGSHSPSAASVLSGIDEASDGSCESGGNSNIDSDTLTLNNGSLTNALKAVTSAIENSSTNWNWETLGSLPARDPKSSIRLSRYGNTLEGLLYVYEDPNNCNGTKFNGQVSLSGYAKAVLYDTVDTGNVSQRKIKARISCGSSASNPGSATAGFYGVLGEVVIVK
jgi:hypothetical protein